VPKTTEHWLLFNYVGRDFTPLSKAFKTKEKAAMQFISEGRYVANVVDGKATFY